MKNIRRAVSAPWSQGACTRSGRSCARLSLPAEEIGSRIIDGSCIMSIPAIRTACPRAFVASKKSRSFSTFSKFFLTSCRRAWVEGCDNKKPRSGWLSNRWLTYLQIVAKQRQGFQVFLACLELEGEPVQIQRTNESCIPYRVPSINARRMCRSSLHPYQDLVISRWASPTTMYSCPKDVSSPNAWPVSTITSPSCNTS
jgi:hypothetical protein